MGQSWPKGMEGANANPMWSYCLNKFPGGGLELQGEIHHRREGNVVNRNSSSAQDQEVLIKPLL